MPKALSRKERRAQKFKQGPLVRQEERREKQTERQAKEGRKRKAPPRFLLFVGNLPYDISEEEIRKHFSTIDVSQIRIRPDKGIAFLEFSGDDASTRLYHALKYHHTRLKNRKINVELTAGGGGNTKERLNKLREKNEMIQKELAESKGKNPSMNKREPLKQDESTSTGNSDSSIHPARLKNIKD